MAYTQPNVTITQVIAPTASSAGVATLKGCVVGPAFQIITDEQAKTAGDADYVGGAGDQEFLFASTDVVDTQAPDTDVPVSAQYPVEVTLKNVLTQLLESGPDLNGSHLNAAGAGLPGLGGGSTFELTQNDSFIEYDAADGASIAVVAQLSVGDFISINTLANHFFLITNIDTAVGEISFRLPGPPAGWTGTSVGVNALSAQVRPFIPVSFDAGASTWHDARFNFDQAPVLISDTGADHLVVTEPTSFSGTLDILDAGAAAGNAGSMDLNGSFLTAPLRGIGGGTVTNGATEVSGMNAGEVATILDLIASGDEVSLFVMKDATFVGINSAGPGATSVTLATSWQGATGPTDLSLCTMGPTTNASYSITRTQADTPIDRADWVFLDVQPGPDGMTLPGNLSAQNLPITAADVHLRYRALDESLAVLKEYANLEELAADFDSGTAGLVPANPYGYAMRKAFENTTGAMSAIGVDGTYFIEGEVAAITEALVRIEEADVYTIALASSHSALPSILKSHVEAQSTPEIAFRRIGVFNRALIESEETLASVDTGSIFADGLTMQDLTASFGVAGVAAGFLMDVTSATSSAIEGQAFVVAGGRWFSDDEGNGFPGVEVGDHLVITLGGDAGTYYIAMNDEDSGNLALSAVSDLSPVNFAGAGVSSEAIAAWNAATNVPPGGGLPQGTLLAAPDGIQGRTDLGGAGDFNIDQFTVTVTTFDTGVGCNATLGVFAYNLSVPLPVTDDTIRITIDDTGTAGVYSAQIVNPLTAPVFSDAVALAGMTLDLAPAGECTINTETGAIFLSFTAHLKMDAAGNNVTMNYTGSVGPLGANSETGNLTGPGVAGGNVDFRAATIDGLQVTHDPRLNGGAGVAQLGAGGITVDYNPRTRYQIIARSASSPLVGEHTINSVTPTSLLFAASVLGDLGDLGDVAGFPPTQWSAVNYSVQKDLSLSEEATALATAASGMGSDRMYMTWPDIAVASINDNDTKVPGWAWNGVVAALVARLPHQQGLTRFSLAGFTGRVNGKDRFLTNERLDTIGGGGVMIFEQASAASPIMIRHQLSTDMSSIYHQELSFRKNLDSITNTFQLMLDGLLGQYNIQEGLFTVIRTMVAGRIEGFISAVVPRFGGQLKPGSKLASLAVDPVLVDTVNMTVNCLLPIPLNHISVTINASS